MDSPVFCTEQLQQMPTPALAACTDFARLNRGESKTVSSWAQTQQWSGVGLAEFGYPIGEQIEGDLR